MTESNTLAYVPTRRPAPWQALALLPLCAVMPVLLLTALWALDKPATLPTELQVTQAEYIISDASTPPAADAAWQPFTGPVWDDTHAPFGSIWLRTDLAAYLDPDRVDALYLPQAGANVTLWIQGVERYASGAQRTPLVVLRTPQLLTVDPYDASATHVWAYLRATREDGFFGGTPVYVGPRELLEPAYDRALRMRSTLPKYIVGLMLVMALLVGVLWCMRREDSAYGWYATTMLLWASHTAHQFTDQPLLPYELWVSANYLSLAWVLSELLFINRFFSLPMRRLERALGAVTAGLALLHVFLSALDAYRWSDALAQYVWTPWIMLLAAIVLVQCVRAVLTRWSVASAGLLVITVTFLATGVRDYLFEYYVRVGSTYYLQYFVLLPLSFFGFLLLRRFVTVLREAEALNLELEQRVARKARDLEQTYRRLGEEARRRELAEARARLMRDMHDGLGGQLVHSLALAQRPEDHAELQDALRDALGDLRLIVDSLGPEGGSFASAFASFRHRCGRILARAGIDGRWEVEGIDDLALEAEQSLGLLRMLQEATTNVVRHSGARQVRIIARGDEAQLLISVVDDGHGIDSDHRGRGLDNMRIRAKEIGARLSIDSGSTGTTVTCTLALPAQAQEPRVT